MLLLLLILMEVYELGLSDVKHYELGKLIHNVFCSCDLFHMAGLIASVNSMKRYASQPVRD